METQKLLLKDEDGEEVDVHLYRLMIGSLDVSYSSRLYLCLQLCARARYQVNPKISHFHAVKRFFRYLKGQPKLGLWYPKDLPFDLVAYTDSDYVGASLDRKSTIEGCQYLGCRLISYQYKKQIVVANSITKAEYVAASSCCGQMKTVNGEVQLQALVDGKKIIVTEASVRRDLRLNDEEGTDCLPNAIIFEELTRMGSRRPKRKDTEVPQPSGPTDNVADEVVYEERDDILERAATTATGLDVEQDRGNIDKTQSKVTPNEPSSPGTSSGGGPRRQETIRDTIAQTRSENVSKFSNDPLLARGNTLRSGEDRLKLQELMELCTNLQKRVIDLENTKTAQAQEITSLKLRVKKLEKKGGSRTHKLKRLYKIGRSARIVSSDEASLGDQEDASKQGRKIDDIDKDAEITLVDQTRGRYGDDIMFDVSDLVGEEVFVAEQGVPDSKKDDVAQVNTAVTIVSTASTIPVSAASITDVEITLAQALAELKSAKPTTTISTRPKDKGLVIHEQEQASTPIVSSQQPSHVKIQDKAIRAKEKRNTPPTKAQKRNTMSTYLKNMAGYKQNQLKNKSFDDIQKLFDKAMKRVDTFVDMDTELVEGSEQKVDEDKETTELQRLIEVVPDKEEVAIDAIPLATKPPSILVKAKYGSTRPVEDLDLVLYGDLKTMFDPHVEDQVWKNQSDYRVLDWKLYDSCGVHSLRKQNVHIHMLVEKRYPLTAPTITDMLNRKLQADHWNEMCYQLLKLLTKQLKNQ
ncbi:hypothetical protein Tco_1337761 [Tanacetum coccineum]